MFKTLYVANRQRYVTSPICAYSTDLWSIQQTKTTNTTQYNEPKGLKQQVEILLNQKALKQVYHY